jgi:transposase
MKTTTIGIDLAKEVFQIHGVDEDGKIVLRKQPRQNSALNNRLPISASR